jgi:hypothetical protein
MVRRHGCALRWSACEEGACVGGGCVGLSAEARGTARCCLWAGEGAGVGGREGGYVW